MSIRRTPADAKAYQRKKYLTALLRLGLELILLILLMRSGTTFLFKRWAEAAPLQFYFQGAFYYTFFFLYLWVFDLFFDLYSGYYLEKAYALSNQNLKGWGIEFLKRSFLIYGFSLPLVLGFYLLIRRFPAHWWIGAWIGFAGVSYLLGQLFPVLIVPLFYRYSRVENETLKKRIYNLAERFGLPLENVYSLNLSKTTKKANAMFAGLGRTKRLVVSDTLIENFSVDEIESVVAHELGHFKHKDIWHHFAFNCAASFVGFAWGFHSLKKLAPGLGYSGPGDLAAFPLLYLIFYLFGILLTPLSNAYSRWREREADRFALKATGPRGFIPAMEKLAEMNLADPHPPPVIEWWFYTHPPIEKRIEMAKSFLSIFLIIFLLWAPTTGFSERSESEDEAARKAIEARGRTEILSYFLGNSKDTSGIKTPFAIDLYNQAVEFYQKREYELARQALQDSLTYDPKSPFALELLGDIDYYEQKLDPAEANYQAAFRLRPRKELKEKMLKIRKEKPVEKGLATYREEHFLVKYGGEEKGLEGFELSESLRNAYREIGQELGYFFKHQVVVLLYDEKEFRELSGAPHWSGGLYDGKIRLPAYKEGFTPKEIEKIMRHEVTHAFVVEMSRGQCPVWLNEGLAVYEEAKIEAPDPRVFQVAIRSNTLLPLPSLFDRRRLQEVTDPLEVRLFYDQSYQLVHYLVERYGMFQLKKMLALYGQGKDTFDVLKEVLKTSPLELEKQWKDAVT